MGLHHRPKSNVAEKIDPKRHKICQALKYIFEKCIDQLKRCTMISLMLQVITDSEGRLVEFDLPGVETEV